MTITKAEFLSNGPKVETFKHPNGSEIVVRQLNELERAQFFTRFTAADGEIDREAFLYRSAILIQLSVIDESGKRMFEESDVDSICLLGSTFITPIHEFLSEFNGFNKEDGVKAARKNSGEAAVSA